MAKAVKVIKVDDVEYSITQIGGVEGLELFDRLTMQVGSNVIEGIRQALVSGKASEDALGVIVMRSLLTIPVEFKRELWTKFAQLTTVKAGSIELPLCQPGQQLKVDDSFDQHFAGRFPHMWKWLAAAMQWGFASFLPSSDAAAEPAPTTPTASP